MIPAELPFPLRFARPSQTPFRPSGIPRRIDAIKGVSTLTDAALAGVDLDGDPGLAGQSTSGVATQFGPVTDPPPRDALDMDTYA
jgi:hypothetical protein